MGYRVLGVASGREVQLSYQRKAGFAVIAFAQDIDPGDEVKRVEADTFLRPVFGQACADAEFQVLEGAVTQHIAIDQISALVPRLSGLAADIGKGFHGKGVLDQGGTSVGEAGASRIEVVRIVRLGLGGRCGKCQEQEEGKPSEELALHECGFHRILLVNIMNVWLDFWGRVQFCCVSLPQEGCQNGQDARRRLEAERGSVLKYVTELCKSRNEADYPLSHPSYWETCFSVLISFAPPLTMFRPSSENGSLTLKAFSA